MPPADEDIVRHARIDATVSKDSRYAYTTHTYYGWRQEPVENCVWRRGFEPIGTGGFGAVFREECIQGSKQGAVRAVKHIQKPTTSQVGNCIDYGRELEAIARFSQSQYEPYFVRSEGWYDTEHVVCIILELIPNGNLQQYVGYGLPEAEAQVLIRQILQGVSYMHGEGYTHRDLKPANLLVVQRGPAWQIKIADFGLSKRLVEDMSSLRTIAGTPGYTAPEILGLGKYDDDDDDDDDASGDSDDQKTPSYTSAVDIWAVGVISFLLLTGTLPFPAANHKRLGKYVRGKAPSPLEQLDAKNLGVSGFELIQRFLAPDPRARPSAASSLQHVWVMSSPSDLKPVSSILITRNWDAESASWNTIASGSKTAVKVSSQTADLTKAPRRDDSNAEGPLQGVRAKDAPHSSDADRAHIGNVISSATQSNPRFRDSGFHSIATHHQKGIADTDQSQHTPLPPQPEEDFAVCRKRTVLECPRGASSESHKLESFRFSPDSRLLAVEYEDLDKSQIVIWDVVNEGKVSSFKGCSPSFSRDGRQIAFIAPDTKSYGGSIFLRDIANGRQTQIIENLKKRYDGYIKVIFMPNGLLATSSIESGVMLWDAAGKVIKKGPGGLSAPWSISPDGRLLAWVKFSNNEIRNILWMTRTSVLLWDMTKEKKSAFVEVHPFREDDFTAATFSPNSRMIAVASCERRSPGTRCKRDSRIIFHDTVGKNLANSILFEGSVWTMAFSPDGKFLAGIHQYPYCGVKDVILWDVKTHAEACRIQPEAKDYPHSLAFSPDGKTLAIGLMSKDVWLYDMLV